MVIIMKKHYKFKRVLSVLLALLFAVMLIVPTTLPVSAANKRFITEIRVEAGEDAVDTLEADGFSVTMVGLNISPDPASQVYLGYKMNTGSPITNVILSPDVGDSCTDKDGVSYQCVSHVDVNEGIGGGAGCLYATRDSNAGAGLVGIDVLRGSDGEEVLYPITNDGAQIVRNPDGAPADLESGGSGVVYLAQIRDGIVRPYISEIGVITDSDKWNAVYTAAERGYDYYVDGDIDGSNDTYTIIGFDRTADPEQAVTGITAVAASTVQALEDEQIVDAAAKQSDNKTAAAVTISGVEYVRITSKPIEAEEPFYIYRTKDKKGGNPISMLYAEKAEQEQNFLLGTWANDYFFSPGLTTAYTYSMNEDLYNTLWEDQTVLINNNRFCAHPSQIAAVFRAAVVKHIPLAVDALYAAMVVPGLGIAAVVVNDNALILERSQRASGNRVPQRRRLSSVDICEYIMICIADLSHGRAFMETVLLFCQQSRHERVFFDFRQVFCQLGAIRIDLSPIQIHFSIIITKYCGINPMNWGL